MNKEELCKGCRKIAECTEENFQAHLKDGIFSCHEESKKCPRCGITLPKDSQGFKYCPYCNAVLDIY